MATTESDPFSDIGEALPRFESLYLHHIAVQACSLEIESSCICAVSREYLLRWLLFVSFPPDSSGDMRRALIFRYESIDANRARYQERPTKG